MRNVTKCPECGFVYEELPEDEIAGRIRGFSERYRAALNDANAHLVSQRPDPQTWSALEYACHVRDVLLVQRDRAVLAEVETKPSFSRMYRDERVAICRYGSAPLEEVLAQLEMAAELCASVFQDHAPEVWTRELVYNFPDPSDRDLTWLGRHTVHEGEHHLQDVHKVLGLVS
jgi:hypothetical protein